MDKARTIDTKAGTLRPLKRELYDRRAAVAIPSATGGRPRTEGDVSAPLAAVTGEEVKPRPLVSPDSYFQGAKMRYAKRPDTFLPTVGRLNRTLEEYTINNEDMVNITTSYLTRVQEHDPGALSAFGSPYEAAQWAVAEIQRAFEPGSAPRVLDSIHQSRTGRQVYNFLRMIEEAQNVES